MPEGIGYGPLPLPPGLTAAPASLPPIPGLTEEALLQPPAIPAPDLVEEQALPPLPVTAEPAEAPVSEWLRQQLEAAQIPAAPADPASTPTRGGEVGAATSSGIPVPLWLQPPANAQPAAIDASDPIALAQAGAQTRVDVERAALQSQRVAQQAIRAAEQRTRQRLEEQAERQRQARERVEQQNAEIQRALREGPGTTWRDVAAAGIQAAAAMLGAAFDRSGTMQRQLPQIMESIVGQWQGRTQGAFARQLQAMQVGREQAQDELDAAMDEERRIEAAGAASRTAILEEAQRQINLAVQEGRVSMAELEAAGIPAQMQAQIEAAKAKQAAELEAQNFERQKRQAEMDKLGATTRLTEEQIKGERADRAKTYADIAAEKERLRLEREKGANDKIKEAIALEKARIDRDIAEGNLSAQQAERKVLVPGTDQYVTAQSPQEAADLRERSAATEAFDQLLQEMEVAAGGTALDKAQTARWAAAITEYRGLANTGTLDKGAMDFVVQVFGDDPAKISIDRLRDQVPQLQAARRAAGLSLSRRFLNRSPEYKALVDKDPGFGPQFTDIREPSEALPSAQEAIKALLPTQSRLTGERARIKPDEFAEHVKTVRETIAKEVAAGQRRDPLTDQQLGEEDALRVQARELAGTLRQMRAERARLEQERAQVQQQASALPRTDARKTALMRRSEELTREIATVEQYDKRLSKELETERRLIWKRAYDVTGGKERLRSASVNREDVRAYEEIKALIGPIGQAR